MVGRGTEHRIAFWWITNIVSGEENKPSGEFVALHVGGCGLSDLQTGPNTHIKINNKL